MTKNINNMTVKELRAEAKELNIKGASRMAKEALIEAITAATSKQSEPEQTTKNSKEIKVALRAFTGMVIDIYTAEKTSKGYTVTLKSGKTMEFNKKGQQITKKSNRFANYIEIL